MALLKQCKNSPNGKHQYKSHQWEHGNRGDDGYKVVSVMYCHWCGQMPKKPGRGWRQK